MNLIDDALFERIEKKLNQDGYGVASSHPVWMLFNFKSEIISAMETVEKIKKLKKLFPENELLKELSNS